jgi:alpha-L-fucosidase 2
VKGICARGGFEISMTWYNHSLKQVTIYSKKGGKTTLIYEAYKQNLVLKAGEYKKIVIN